jgi:hypothetical protein
MPLARSTRGAIRTALTLCVLCLPGVAHAQRGGGGFGRGGGYSVCRNSPPIQNAAYDGRFVIARLMYESGPGGCYYRGEPSWAHGYGFTQNGPAEQNLMKIVGHVSSVRTHVETTNVLAIGDPDLSRYPVAFLVEAGYLTLSAREVHALHDYIVKGGFLIIDDSREDGMGGWANLAAMMQLVLPGLHPIAMTPAHPIFHAFYNIPSFDIVHQSYDRGPPVFRGIFEGNDPAKRLLVMINFNTDVSDYWEFSATGFLPIDATNEAYKLGVNYVLYALTH